MSSRISEPSLSQTFLVGLMALLPLALTIAAIIWVTRAVEQFLGPESSFGSAITTMGLSFVESQLFAYALGILIVLFVIYLLGAVLQRGLANRFRRFIRNLFARVPIVSNIYDLSDRFVSVLGAKDDPALKKMTPAWCFIGGESKAAVLGLLPHPEPIEIEGTEYLGVLVPFAPVPIGGGLLFVPKDWVKPADFGVEGLTSIYVTMGISAPVTLKDA